MKTGMLIVALLLMCATVQAETYVFVGSHFPILSEETPTGEFRGIAIDIAKIITERLGHTISIRLYPWARAQYLVRNGSADVLMAPYKTPEREKWLDFTKTPFFDDKTFFYVSPRSTVSWDGDLMTLAGKRIGMVLDWSVGPEFEKAKEFLSVEYANTLDACVKKLLAQRIDLLPTQAREATVVFSRLSLSEEQRPIPILPEISVNYNYFGFSKSKELSAFRDAFEQELAKMKQNGEIAKLLQEKYGFSD